ESFFTSASSKSVAPGSGPPKLQVGCSPGAASRLGSLSAGSPGALEAVAARDGGLAGGDEAGLLVQARCTANAARAPPATVEELSVKSTFLMPPPKTRVYRWRRNGARARASSGSASAMPSTGQFR